MASWLRAVRAIWASPVVAQNRQKQMVPAQGAAIGNSAQDAPAPRPPSLPGDVPMGKWCGDTTTDVFSASEMRVEFHSGGTRILKLDRVKAGGTCGDLHEVGRHRTAAATTRSSQSFRPTGRPCSRPRTSAATTARAAPFGGVEPRRSAEPMLRNTRENLVSRGTITEIISILA